MEPPTVQAANELGHPATSGSQRFEFLEHHLGSHVRLVFYAEDARAAAAAAEACYHRVQQLDAVLSNYRPDSELMRLCRSFDAPAVQEPFAVTPELFCVLQAAQYWSCRSQGAFDITVAPLARLWKRAIRQGTRPEAERLQAAQQLVGYEYLQLDAQRQTARLTRPGVRLDVGGIAKGYIADQLLRQLETRGIRQALVDAGGDLAVGDPPPAAHGWRVAVDTGRAGERAQAGIPEPPRLRLARCGVATSGDAFQHVELDGQRYAHLIDPRTGQPVQAAATVTVVAGDAMAADAMASAVAVMGPQAGRRWLASIAGAAGRIQAADGEVWSSADFPAVAEGNDS